MPTKLRSSDLQTSTARLKLTPRRAPYRFRVASGIALGYRRTEGTFGTWSAIVADGGGREQLKKFANADDREAANGKTVLSFDQAMTQARLLARGETESETNASLVTVKAALAAYRVDLLARSADLKNADRPRRHLGTLLQKPCVLLTKDELTTWRNGLVSKGRLTPSSINRVMSTLRAALTLACPERTQIWRDGLTALPNAEKSRNALFVLPDATIIALVAKAYAKDAKLGFLCDVLAETGMRPSQAARARVGYLIMHASAPRLLVNKRAKGGGKLRAQKKLETYALPISVGLAAKLKQAVRGRAEDDKLLVNADGQPLNEADVHTDYRAPFTEIVQALGLIRRSRCTASDIPRSRVSY